MLSRDWDYHKDVGHQIFVQKKHAIMKTIDMQMEENDEMTLEELRLQLEKEGINVSVSSVHPSWQDHG